jgi:type III pantothenate kinase
MILAAELGNSRAKFAFFEGPKKKFAFAVSVSPDRTEDEWRLLLSSFCREGGVEPARTEGAVFAGVNPPKSAPLLAALTSLFGKKPLIVGPGIRTGLDIRTDYQSELGADIVANAAGACGRAKPPFFAADLGTAITLFAVDEKGVFRGVDILPGVSSSLAALARDCAGLPEVGVRPVKTLFGKNTADSVSAGVAFGFASMLDGMARRAAKELGAPLTLFATGGDAPAILPFCESPFLYAPDLTLEGLARLYELNKTRKA